MIVAATGHRPDDIAEPNEIVTLKARVQMQGKATRLICGMAAGFDLLAADAAIELGIPITAAVPWMGHQASLPKEWQDHWQKVYDYSDTQHFLDERMAFPGKYIYFKRNEWMVDNADVVMAYWSGKEVGGTFHCVTYADGKKPITNIFNDPPF